MVAATAVRWLVGTALVVGPVSASGPAVAQRTETGVAGTPSLAREGAPAATTPDNKAEAGAADARSPARGEAPAATTPENNEEDSPGLREHPH